MAGSAFQIFNWYPKTQKRSIDLQKMDFSTLPPEVQFQYLLELPTQDVLRYCQTSVSARKICQDPYFWDQKAALDYGIPFSSICNLEPYWRYRLMGSLSANPAMVGPLLRAKRPDLVRRIIKIVGTDFIDDAIYTDDPVVLDFVKSKSTIVRPNPRIREWILQAFSYGSANWLRYLTQMEPDLMEDPAFLNEILDYAGRDPPTIDLLAPFIERLRREVPNLLQIAENQPLDFLHDYLIHH